MNECLNSGGNFFSLPPLKTDNYFSSNSHIR